MCNHKAARAASLPVPSRLAALKLTLGPSTEREINVCPEDGDHEVIVDSRAEWDPALQDWIHTDVYGGASCSTCGAEAVSEQLFVVNRAAVMNLRKAMRCERDAIAKAIASTDGKLIIMACEKCGSYDVLADGYSEPDPLLDSHDLTTTFNKGATCESCGCEPRMEEVQLSKHEALEVLGKGRDRIRALDREIFELDQWLLAEGYRFHLEPADVETIVQDHRQTQVCASA